MESLAYVHMALEHEKSLQPKSNSEQIVCQQPVVKPFFGCQNWLSFKLFGWLQHKESKKLVNQ